MAPPRARSTPPARSGRGRPGSRREVVVGVWVVPMLVGGFGCPDPSASVDPGAPSELPARPGADRPQSPPTNAPAIGGDPELPEETLGGALEPKRSHGAPGRNAGRSSGAPTLRHIAVYGADKAAGGPERADVARVALHFDEPAAFERGTLAPSDVQPSRLYLEFDRARLPPRGRRVWPVGMAGVRRARALEPEPGRLRVVFDLDGDVRHRSFVLADPFRVLVDFDARASMTESRQGPVIVLDPGHGGRDRGARSAGASEAHLALDIARRARRVLRRRIDRARVLLTRDGDDFVSLEQRTAMANAAEADLFVSIHLNASDEPIEHGGVASFVLDTSDDEQALRLAARENGTTKEQVTGLSRLVAGLHRDRQVSASRGVARRLQASVVRGGRSVLPQLADRGVKEALFYVLVGARMPAVLVEASFLSHPEEARALQTERYRQALAEGLAHGIEVALEP